MISNQCLSGYDIAILTCVCRLTIQRLWKESFHGIVLCRHMSRRWSHQTSAGSIYCLLLNLTRPLPSRFVLDSLRR